MKVTDEMVRVACDAYNEKCDGAYYGATVNPMRSALAAALNAMWRPMDEAPTNTAILIKLPNLDYYGNNSVYAGMLVDMGTGKRWTTFGCAIGRDIAPNYWPIAWWPLPSPPAGEK